MNDHNNLERKIREYKQSRIPSFLGGDLETLINSQLRKVSDIDFVNILHEGKTIGRHQGHEEGIELGIKNFILSGENQLFVTKEGDVYPFSNMEELYKSEKTSPYIKEFLKDYALNEKIPKLEYELNRSLGEIQEYNKNLLLESTNLLGTLEKTHQDYIQAAQDLKNSRKANEYTSKIKKISEDIENVRSTIKYRKNSKIEEILEKEPKLLEDMVLNKAKLLGDKTSKTIKNVNKLNDSAILEIKTKIKLNPNIQYKTPKKTSPQKKVVESPQERLDQRENLKKLIDIYDSINSINNLKETILSTKLHMIDEIDKAPIQSLAGMFRDKNIKPGDTAIFKSDQFDIYNINELRKLLNKRKGLQEIRQISSEIYDKSEMKHINDMRSNPIPYERTIDYINIPKTKVNLFEKKITERFHGNIPQDIQLFMKALGENK